MLCYVTFFLVHPFSSVEVSMLIQTSFLPAFHEDEIS